MRHYVQLRIIIALQLCNDNSSVPYLLLSSLLCGGLYRNNFSQRVVCSKFIPTTARRVRLFKMRRQTGLWWPTREPLFFSSCMQCCVKQAPSEPSLQEPSRLLTVLQHQTWLLYAHALYKHDYYMPTRCTSIQGALIETYYEPLGAFCILIAAAW